MLNNTPFLPTTTKQCGISALPSREIIREIRRQVICETTGAAGRVSGGTVRVDTERRLAHARGETATH